MEVDKVNDDQGIGFWSDTHTHSHSKPDDHAHGATIVDEAVQCGGGRRPHE